MSFTRATGGKGSGSGGAAFVDASAFNLAAGALVIAAAKCEGAAGTIDSITDTAGNTYLPLTGQSYAAGGEGRVRLFYCLSATANAANVARANYSSGSSAFRYLVVQSYTYAGTASFVDEAFATDNSTAADSGSMTAGKLAVGVLGEFTGSTITEGAGWTKTDTDSTMGGHFLDRVDNPGGTINCTATVPANYWGIAAATFTDSGEQTEQEGFRFGIDDAAESAHTWSQAQDADDTVSVGTARLIRAIINGIGDPVSSAYTLRYQKNGSGGYVAVPVGSTVPASYGTVTFGAIGTGANGSTTVAPSYPAGITAGQYLTCHVSSGATNNETPTTPSGWTLLATGASTDGTFGVDAGPRRMTVFGKIAVGTESGTLTVSITNGNTCRGTIARWTKAGSGSWDVSAQGANDSTSGTGFSATAASINWNTGDCAIVAVGQRVDTVTQSSQSLTASGVTFGTRTNRASTAVTTGNDHRHVVDTFAAVSATSNVDAAPTWAFTGSAACSGGVVVVRLREYTAAVANEIYVSPSSNIAGGGEATTARLTSPSGKTSSDFTTGRRWDDENGSDSIDIASDFYTELEWSLNTQAPAVNGDYFDLRVYAGASVLTSYTVTPRLTLGSAGGTVCNPMTGIGGAAARPLAA